MSRMLVVLAVVVTAPVVTGAPVGAHAEIRESDPARGGTAPAGLDELSMTFIAFDPAGPVEVEVTDDAGTDVVAGEPQVSARDSVVTVPLEPLEEGAYAVHWHARSDDGDGMSEGTFRFTVASSSSGIGTWLLWLVALIVPALIFLRPGARGRRGRRSS